MTSSSSVFEAILKRNCTPSTTTVFQDFFDDVWQKQPMLFPPSTTTDKHPQLQQQQQQQSTKQSLLLSPSLSSRPSSQSGSWNEDVMMKKTALTVSGGDRNDKNNHVSPWDEMIHQRWYILESLLENSQQRVNSWYRRRHLRQGSLQSPSPQDLNDSIPNPKVHDNDDEDDANDEISLDLPILFRDQRPIPLEDFDRNIYGGYLDGCSIVLNHADLQQEHIAALCLDLQSPSSSSPLSSPSFPHVYANVYITPPGSQTAPPHADDRDVLIFQLIGSKQWTIYQNVPVPYPYPHEQVGKDGLAVPSTVLEGPKVIFDQYGHSVSTPNTTSYGSTSTTLLCEGDVLYLPRGMVHQARCATIDSPNGSNIPSVHITVAIATHDWTLAGNLGRMIQQRLQRVVSNRMSLLPLPSSFHNDSSSMADVEKDTEQVQGMIDEALHDLRQHCTAQTMLKEVASRIDNHNRRSFPLRMKLIHEARMRSIGRDDEKAMDGDSTLVKVGPALIGLDAASKVSFKSWIRAATPAEREMVNQQQQQQHQQRLLHQQQDDGPNSTSSKRQPGLQVREDIADVVMSLIAHVKSHPTQSFRVADLRSIIEKEQQEEYSTTAVAAMVTNPLFCDLAVLCVVKKAAELGAFAVCE